MSINCMNGNSMSDTIPPGITAHPASRDVNLGRYEIKYLLEPTHRAELENWVLARPFITRAHPPREIATIYFDTIDLRAARENLRGLPHRQKFRARWYVPAQSSGIHLEVKQRIGRLGYKYSTSYDRSSSTLLNMGSDELMAAFSSSSEMSEFAPRTPGLVPIIEVRYFRHYFKGPSSIRITIDDKLEFLNFFKSPSKDRICTASYRKIVVEFKFPLACKDYAAQLMTTLPFYPVRNSKYLLGLALTGNTVYL